MAIRVTLFALLLFSEFLSVAQMCGSDSFGTVQIYPTIGREWNLPSDATKADAEWFPESLSSNPIITVSPGVFHISGQVRLNVTSPASKTWWRNVEMTGFFRYTGDVTSTQSRHWEFQARGERHSSTQIAAADINRGVQAPAGTETWPGYPFSSCPLNVHCLGTAYHGNFYLDGSGLFEKELSHSSGYADQRGKLKITGQLPSSGSWFGMKFVVRNGTLADTPFVRLELWIDQQADGNWILLSRYDDVSGAWAAQTLDGCDMLPFGFTADRLINWAGPWVTFRSDAMGIDFKSLSVREIAPY